MANVASVSVEHHHCDIGIFVTAWAAAIESRQLLAIVCRNDQFFEVVYTKLRRARHIGSRIGRHM